MTKIVDHFGPDWPKVIDIGIGWTDLINNLHDKLAYISPDYHIQQVKQKFGGLRYYATYVPKYDEADPEKMRQIFLSLISDAEQRSYSICETCGEYGRLEQVNYTYFVGCSDHKHVPMEYYV